MLPPDGDANNLSAIGKIAAIAGVQITLRRQPVSQQHLVIRQLNMKIANLINRQLNDRGPIQQVTRGDQHATNKDRVIRADQQLNPRAASPDRTRRH